MVKKEAESQEMGLGRGAGEAKEEEAGREGRGRLEWGPVRMIL